MAAAFNGHEATVTLLLDRGADVNQGSNVSDYIFGYLLPTTHFSLSVSVISIYYRMDRLHLRLLPKRVIKKLSHYCLTAELM